MKNEAKLGILATLKAKPGKEAELEAFLKSALPLANQEAGMSLPNPRSGDLNLFKAT